MCFFNKLLFGFLYFTAIIICHVVRSDKLSDLQNAVIKNNIHSEKSVNDDNISIVFVNTNKYVIYVYDPTDSNNRNTAGTKPSSRDELIAAAKCNNSNGCDISQRKYKHYIETNLLKFYVCMNCKFAAWIRNELYRFTGFFPLSFYTLHMNVQNGILKVILNATFDILENIMEHVERFISILFNFINTLKYISLIDTSILKSLWSLRLKLNFIETLRHLINKQNDDYLIMLDDIYASEAIVIRIILEVINSIERFMALNCSIPSFYYNNKEFVDEKMASDESNQNDSIEKFLEDIQPLNLEISETNRCRLREILFESIMEKSSTDSISSEIGNAKWVRGSKFVYIKDVYERLKYSHSPEVIFLYQQLVFKTIVQLICSKVMDFYGENEGNLPNAAVDKFETIREQVLSKYPSLPIEFTNFFRLLESEKNYSGNRTEFVEKLSVYMSNDIDIGTSSSPKPGDFDETNRALNGNGAADPSPKSSLSDFMAKITNVRDWHCFFQTYELFHTEYGRYYYPAANRPNDVQCFLRPVLRDGGVRDAAANNRMLEKYFGMRATADDEPYHGGCAPVQRSRIDGADEGCKLVTGLYHYCRVAVGADDPAEARAVLEYVADRLVEAADRAADRHWSRPILRTAYDVVPLLETYAAGLSDGGRLDELRRRLLRAVTAVLDDCALDVCRPPGNNFTLFNNTAPGRDLAAVRRQIESSLAALSHGSAARPRNFHDFRNLYAIVTGAGDAFRQYERYVTIGWKGASTDVDTVLRHLKSIVTDPTYLYGFYDIVVKYLVAALFFEISSYVEYMALLRRERDDRVDQLTRDNCEKYHSNHENLFTDETFPDSLDYLKNSLKNYLNIADLIFCSGCKKNASDPVLLKKMENLKTKIEHHFIDLNIGIHFDRKEPINIKFPEKPTKHKWRKKKDVVEPLSAEILYKNVCEIRSVLQNIYVKFNLLTVFV